jgi:hypothetical protein
MSARSFRASVDPGNFVVATVAEDGSEKRISSLSREAAITLATAHRAAGRRCAIRFVLSGGMEVSVVGFDEPLDRMSR